MIRDLAAAIVNTPLCGGSDGRVLVPVRLSLPAFDPALGDYDLNEVPTEW